jgi:hypothetical protein
MPYTADQQFFPRSVAWICTNSSLFDAGKAMLDNAFKDPATHNAISVCSGSIGTRRVVIILLPPSGQASSDETVAQELSKSLDGLEVLVTSSVSEPLTTSTTLGDLIISSLDNWDSVVRAGDLSHNLLETANLLHREAGVDGRWLSSKFTANIPTSTENYIMQQSASDLTEQPKLHYTNIEISEHMTSRMLVRVKTSM